MRAFLHTMLLAIIAAGAGACSNARAVANALYVAVVHNSYAPPRAERDSIDARERAMLAAFPRARVLVVPVVVLGRAPRYDTTAALALATRISQGVTNARASDAAIVLPFEPQPNEAVIFWTRFRALADSVRAHPPADADYVLLVDVFGTRAGAVHALAVTPGGEMVYRRLWNSHQPLYKEVRPSSVDDAVQMVALDLERSAAAAKAR